MTNSHHSRYSHLVFDWDGTLVDTDAPIAQAESAILEKHGVRRTPEQMRPYVGIPTFDTFARFGIQASPELWAEWQEQYQRFAHHAVLFPGVAETLRKLRGDGVALGMISSRRREEFHQLFDSFGLNALFDADVFSNDTEKHKPDAEPMLRYLEKTGAAAGDCVYIGDMPTDIQCAAAAGVDSALMEWGGERRDRSGWPAKPTYVLDSARDWLGLV